MQVCVSLYPEWKLFSVLNLFWNLQPPQSQVIIPLSIKQTRLMGNFFLWIWMIITCALDKRSIASFQCKTARVLLLNRPHFEASPHLHPRQHPFYKKG